MFQHNAKHGMQFNYISFQFVDGYWFAWYYMDLTDNFTGKVKEIFEENVDGQ